MSVHCSCTSAYYALVDYVCMRFDKVYSKICVEITAILKIHNMLSSRKRHEKKKTIKQGELLEGIHVAVWVTTKQEQENPSNIIDVYYVQYVTKVILKQTFIVYIWMPEVLFYIIKHVSIHIPFLFIILQTWIQIRESNCQCKWWITCTRFISKQLLIMHNT